MNIDNFINKFQNHPVLFLGTGFSLRYLENSFSWEELLKFISYELTNNTEKFLDLKSKNQNEDGSYCWEKIAADLEVQFNKYLSKDGNRYGKFENINDLFYENMNKNINVSRFKLYILTLLEKLKYRENKENEIQALKKARKNIGSIITTNYDELIEELFQFKPLVGNDILLSNPYGSVYKIHGCVKKPEKIIITEDDYKIFDEKYELIKAQLLSLFIHNPIIFMGYSVGDRNIQKILKTIFTYVPVNSKIAQKIKSNFLLVEYEKDSTNIQVNDHDIALDDGITIRVNKIKTDNFKEIYESISKLKLPVSAMDIRKVQSIVKEIYEGGSIQVSITDDIDKLKNSEKVIAIGNINKIKYEYQTTGEMMENYFEIIEEDNSQLIQLIDKQRIQSGQYFPIFAFSKINPGIVTAEKLKNQQISKLKILKKVDKKFQNRHDKISDIIKDASIATSNKTTAIIYSICNNSVNINEIEKHLKNHDNKYGTAYRKILCIYDYIKYSDDESIINC